jgi:hypothetical protein
MHGCGVSTPIAAAVAAATCGLAGHMHIPNDAMLVIGTESIMVPAGIFEQATRFVGRTVKTDGAIPKVQASVAPETTCMGMLLSSSGCV